MKDFKYKILFHIIDLYTEKTHTNVEYDLIFVNKIGYNEYNNDGYLISAIIKNVSRNPICVE